VLDVYEIEEINDETLNVLIIGVGTVGCKILSETIDTEHNDHIKKLYLHTSRSFLSEATQDDSEKIEINSHIHFYEDRLIKLISNHNMVFIVAGLGGQSGSFISPYIAKLVKNTAILCIGLFSFPFSFEGRNKKLLAQQAYINLAKHTDSLICIDNDSFLQSNLADSSLSDSKDIFKDSNSHFQAAIKGITGLMLNPGMINVDFGDLKVILRDMGSSTVGYSKNSGVERAVLSVTKLLESPAVKGFDLSQAKGCIINISAGLDLTLGEFTEVGHVVEEFMGEDATVVFGTCVDQGLGGVLEVTAVITGLAELPIENASEDDSFDFVTVSKHIEFEAHQASAGLSILSYFNEFIHQKYSGTEAKVKIEQEGHVVKLIIETPTGEIENIEKSLHEFGLVVVGKKEAGEVLDRKADIEKLNMKLEMAAMELRHNEKIMLLYQNENKDKSKVIEANEKKILSLQDAIFNQLSVSQHQISTQIQSMSNLPDRLAKLIEANRNTELTENSKEIIRDEIEKEYANGDSLVSLRELVANSVYGVGGNSLFLFISQVINSLPK
jgi:cell division GTPase FtsZ